MPGEGLLFLLRAPLFFGSPEGLYDDESIPVSERVTKSAE